MRVPRVGRTDIHVVDTHLLGFEGALSLYVVDSLEPTIVDTGAANTTDTIFRALERLRISREAVEHVLVSHVHLDHAGGAGELARELPNATFYVHEKGLPYLTDADSLEALKLSVDRATGREDAFGVPEPVPPERCVSVSGGELLDIGDRELELVDAPGHAPHHYAAYDEGTGALFSIDSAGMYQGGRVVPTTPPPSFDPDATVRTAKRLKEYEPTVNLYGHFGPGGDDPVEELVTYARLIPEFVALVEDLAEEHENSHDIVEALGPRWASTTLERDVRGVLHYLGR
jgi:glyoxylase-like metal-dependent hydrolase (beta-lactamase superfamily II)